MDTLAPWAEPVLMTAGELLQLPEDGWRYELVEGRLVRMSPTGGRHGQVAAELLLAVGQFTREHDLGALFAAETGFWISAPEEPDTVLAPDLALVRAERELRPVPEGYPRQVPDLVAEVASPSQGRAELGAKAERWLRAGVRLVWVVFPETRTVERWRSGEAVSALTVTDELSGEDILPGFTCPVAQLFP